MKEVTPFENRKLICYALLGYIEFIRRNGAGDVNFNFIFGPRKIAKIMKEHGVEAEILDVFHQIDEIESIISRSSLGDYEIATRNLYTILIDMLKREHTFIDNTSPALLKLL